MRGISSLTSLSQLADTEKATVLMHCRPRIQFHLGNLWMLNNLDALLTTGGHEVYILIIPYDEDLGRNPTLIERSRQEVKITKKFVARYLSNHANLNVYATYDLDLRQENLDEAYRIWRELVADMSAGDPIHELVKLKRRVWASPTFRFVAKCISFINLLGPSHVICGAKHLLIAQCFDIALGRISDAQQPAIITVEDFLDLNMQQAMDATDSAYSFISADDSKDIITTKLALAPQREVRADWIPHCLERFVFSCPRKYIEDVEGKISLLRGSDVDQGLFTEVLIEILSKVSSDLPYVNTQSPISGQASTVDIRWGAVTEIEEEKRQVFAKLIRSLFLSVDVCDIYVRSSFSEGLSGAYVFEVLTYLRGSQEVNNSAVLKIGKAPEISMEHSNYMQFIRERRTFAFVEVSEPSIEEKGWKGILYRDVKRWLGNQPGDNIVSASTYLSENWNRLDKEFSPFIKGLFHHLEQVIQNRRERVERRTLASYYSEILPAKFVIEVNTLENDRLIYRYDDTIQSGEIFDGTGFDVTEISGQGLRVYSRDKTEKLDIVITDEQLRRRCAPLLGSKISLSGRIVNDLQGKVSSFFAALGQPSDSEFIEIENCRFLNPLPFLDRILTAELSWFIVSAVHGDLHLDNILCSSKLFEEQKYVVIDYATIRSEFPTIHDFVVFVANFKTQVISRCIGVEDAIKIERGARNRELIQWRFGKKTRSHKLLSNMFHSPLIQFDFLTHLGPPKLYHACMALYSFSMLKFDNLDLDQKKIAFASASCSLEQITDLLEEGND